jgi:hypothetical protein
MKKELHKLEEMIRHETGEVASTNGKSHGDTSASEITSLLAEDLLLNPQAAVSATGEDGAPRLRRR